MINLTLKSEFSFRSCFMHMDDMYKYATGGVLGIADLNNTFGHIKFAKMCKKHDIKPIFGVRLNVMEDDFIDPKERARRCNMPFIFLARNDEGLKEIYRLVKRAYDNFYYIPRLTCQDVSEISANVVVIASRIIPGLPYNYLGVNCNTPDSLLDSPIRKVAIQDNYYPTPQDRGIYQLAAGTQKRADGYSHQFESRSYPQHILSEAEFLMHTRCSACIDATYDIAIDCNASIEQGEMVSYTGSENIREICEFNAMRKEVPLDEDAYKERFEYELNLVKEKGYEDYFLIVSDMIRHAKKSMLVGPSRGSSAGSLVCYLMDITEVDPIEHGLIFERFIDINRFDLPDIDIDFPDIKREQVIKYLGVKYGSSNVSCLGTISRLMPKSAIGEFAQSLGIPKYETEDVKNSIIERSSGDARAAMCIRDTFESTDIGKAFIAQYPKMSLVSEIEGHARHSGKHAAGIIVSTKDLTEYGGINSRDGIMMMDKKDAEAIGLLKIDVLGLRTLSILEESAMLAGFGHLDYYDLPLDDQKAFDVFNGMRLNGIFQFEGYALQSLTRQMGVHEFNDIVAITSLARPGALNSGGASRYVEYKTGRKEPHYFNSIHEEITKETFGIVIYQEQMMEISRKIGQLSWADTSDLRRAASKSLGDEFFANYKERFVEGAMTTGLTEKQSIECWTDIMSFGSWAFNKSHAVSYGLISYWTAYMKAHHPLAFATASLNNARDDEHALKLLRDMVKHEHIEYKPVDSDLSIDRWSFHDNVLLGGLTNIKGIGPAKAKSIIKSRATGKALTHSLYKALMDPKTNFDILFPAMHYWGDLYNNPASVGMHKRPDDIESIDDIGEYIFIGCLMDRNLRDLNEYNVVQKRGGKIETENIFYLNMTVEDDTDSIICTINRYRFEELGGRKIAEEAKVGETWYLIRGKIQNNWRRIDVTHIYNLNEWRKSNAA